MSVIRILDDDTINQIAAGEVVERPKAVVKELIENSIDAKATAVTVEIKEGGLSFIRITDNGTGMAKEDIPLAFMRHATSKIKSAEDLFDIKSLGFRGEALSSIAAVSQVELITKEPSSLNGYRYIIEGGTGKSLEEIGCPDGTTVIVRNLFYNTPARRKFLKSAKTEAGYINDLMEKLILSHPGISFRFIMNNKLILQSSGNNNIKDILYHIYGRDIAREILYVEYSLNDAKISGYIGKPAISRGNRNYMNYFINGRYIKSNIITKAIEDAYKPYMMQHKYPFTSLYYTINPAMLDVNVHPQKLELKLKNADEIYELTFRIIKETLSGKELIHHVSLSNEEEKVPEYKKLPEPFEKNRINQLKALEILADYGTDNHAAFSDNFVRDGGGYSAQENAQTYKGDNTSAVRNLSATADLTGFGNRHDIHEIPDMQKISHLQQGISNKQVSDFRNVPDTHEMTALQDARNVQAPDMQDKPDMKKMPVSKDKPDMQEIRNLQKMSETKQMDLFAYDKDMQPAPFLSAKAVTEHRIIGQVFSTYWLVEYKNELYIIDQHAAHEKVLYERIMAAARENKHMSQMLMPPIVFTLSLTEQQALSAHEQVLKQLGYEIEHFGGNEFSLRAVPSDLYGLSDKDLFLEFIDELTQDIAGRQPNPESLLEKTATLACKAAVKANHEFSFEEASALIKELLSLENPYNCPHGRPVIISISQYELEKKFKRIV